MLLNADAAASAFNAVLGALITGTGGGGGRSARGSTTGEGGATFTLGGHESLRPAMGCYKLARIACWKGEWRD